MISSSALANNLRGKGTFYMDNSEKNSHLQPGQVQLCTAHSDQTLTC